MIKVTKQGITKFILKNDLQKFENLGYKKIAHTLEPMVIKETKQQTQKTIEDKKTK